MKGSGDTIAAVATAPGRGGVAIVRVSGPDAFVVAERLTGRRPRPRAVALYEVHEPPAFAKATAGRRATNHEPPAFAKATAGRRTTNHEPRLLLDTAVVLAFEGPRSYTGEDVVEFQCHGGSVTPRRVLEACFAAGARLARRGEFTERAFLNGRLTYEQAEGVLDLVNAKTDRAADAALQGLAGARRAEMRAAYDALVALSSTSEHALDVSEEELPEGFVASLESGVASVAARLESALRRAREGRILRDGALVVIAGPPNAGKSSLMNALLGEDRAIVSDVPGTTRDSIEEWLDVGGWPVRLVDTAGLRDTSDAVEGEGVARARSLARQADVVVRLTPADGERLNVERLNVEGQGGAEPFDSRLSTVGSRGPSVIDVISKCDLLPPSTKHLAPRTSAEGAQAPSTSAALPRASALFLSAKTGEGLDALRGAIAAELARRAEGGREDGPEGDCDAAALAETLALLRPCGGLAGDLVLVANRVRAASERLGAAVGAEYSSDLLDSLFSRFCVGK